MFHPYLLEIDVSYDSTAALWKGRLYVQYHNGSMQALDWAAYAHDQDRSQVVPKLNYELAAPGSKFVLDMLTVAEWRDVYSRVQFEKHKNQGLGWYSVWARWSGKGIGVGGMAGTLSMGQDPINAIVVPGWIKTGIQADIQALASDRDLLDLVTF